MKNKGLLVRRSFFVIGFLCAVLVVFGVGQIIGYRSNINAMLPTLVKYKNTSISTYLSSDICDYLTDGRKTIFWGEIPNDGTPVEICSPERATLVVYPLDNDSIIVRYIPEFGLPMTYKISGYGNFDALLNSFYELTGDEAFSNSTD